MMVSVKITARRVILEFLALFTVSVGVYNIRESLDYLHKAVGTNHPEFKDYFNRCGSFIEKTTITRRKSTAIENSNHTSVWSAFELEFRNANSNRKIDLSSLKNWATAAQGLLKLANAALNIYDTPFCRVIKHQVAAGYMTLAVGVAMLAFGIPTVIMNVVCAFKKFKSLRPYPLLLLCLANVLASANGAISYYLVQYARDKYILWRNSFLPREACIFVCKYIPIHSAIYSTASFFHKDEKWDPIGYVNNMEAIATRINGAITSFVICLIIGGAVSTVNIVTMLFMVSRNIK